MRECNYRHEEDWQERTGVVPGTFSPIAPLPLPAEMIQPGYQRIVRAGRNWGEIFPGLQCYVRNPVPEEDGSVTLCLRLTPEGATSEPTDRF